MLSPIGPDELLFRLSEKRAQDDTTLLLQLGVTSREAEVLLWAVAREIQPRDRRDPGHQSQDGEQAPEQIFVKLGVENRASAAARAARLLVQ